MTEAQRVRAYYVAISVVIAGIGIWALLGGGVWPLSLVVLPAFVGWWWAMDARPSWGWWDDARWWSRLLVAVPAGLVVAFALVAPLAERSLPVAGLLVAEIVVLLGMAAWSAADGPAWVPAGLVVVLGCAAGLFLGSDGTLLNRHCQRIATTGAQYQECVDQINADRITGHDTAAAP